ncbi:MAG TPA: histidine ammonia-lyase [Candidatus Baltobacteraceae bacterium]|jgi:histidine ammonia-lyase|nr:histidine ammonia-lyase [Candidatus Baltobacteraceae bacterium]
MATTALPTIDLDGKQLSLEAIRHIAEDGAQVRITADARARVAAARRLVDERFGLGDAIYGVTTGFGRLANVKIDPKDAAQLQLNLVRSHAAGTGEPLSIDFVRAAGVLRASSLAAGHSGIKETTLDLLVELLNRGVTPVVPRQGSVGASGDLAPLAHMTLTLIGEGEAYFRGERMSSAQALKLAGLEPIELGAKEGLALVNGTEVMTGIAALCLLRAERLIAAADVIGAMALEAFLGTDRVFDRRINALRPHPGQGRVADNLRALLHGSQIMESHRECGRVQDPYSYRCIPVVHGAVRDAAAHARKVIETEAISVTDNPLVFPDDGEFLTGGNFHGQPVALACDLLKIALAELAGISERRLYLLLNAEERGLPLFLTGRSGLQSGLMIVQYTSAAMVSENKALAWPNSVDSIPTSAGQEDHVSMGMTAAVHLDRVLQNVEGALACELLGALTATDIRRPLRSGIGTQAAHETARRRISVWNDDRIPAPDIAAARELLRSGEIVEAAQEAIGMSLIGSNA